ncbi:NUDIX hydrolase [Consotaella aegiceratis]|uniref:NUDIX hydrolase n=1 Tax=Consotaella aegiceratis TaxID=3097961 RepID=UPI002F425F2C
MFQTLESRWLDRAMLKKGGPGVYQSGAMPYTVVDGQAVFLLITSRRSGRWIFPKGSPIDGLTPWQTAQQEALEEAGVEGTVDRVPIGSYRTLKRGIRSKVLDVELYPLKVTVQHESWQENGQRYRHWAILPEAKRLIADKALAALAVRLAERVAAQRSFATTPIEFRTAAESDL